MNRAQFRTAFHEFREVNFSARRSAGNHICTARNCACRDVDRDPHAGWQWRIAQFHGEGMATRLRRMIDRRKFSLPPVSAKAEKAVREYWGKKERQSILNVARAQIAQKFEGRPEPDWPTSSTAPVQHRAAGGTSFLRSSNTPASAGAVVPFVCSLYGDAS